MNDCMLSLFDNKIFLNKLAKGLPIAFEKASIELPRGNPAVGFLREHALIGYFQNCFGADKVKSPKSGVKRGYDVEVCGELLSIKTVTGNGEVKLIWTSDNVQVDEEIESRYKVVSDMFLVRIFWDKNLPSIFYIPKKAQEDIMHTMGRENYLLSRRKTNNRGISINRKAMRNLQNHSDTRRANIYWEKRGIEYSPYDRWAEFWESDLEKM